MTAINAQDDEVVIRPRLLDLFCGAGGAAVGYHRAGFDVVGVDVEPQPNYPFEFIQTDALEFLDTRSRLGSLPYFEAIHASPPCHDHSTITGRNRKANGPHGTGWMLDATIERLAGYGIPWVVENVESAEFPPGVFRARYCGSSFGLDLRRHRWFASSEALLVPACDHSWQTPRFRSLDSRQKSMATVIGVHGHLNYSGEFELRCQAMGIDWMTNAELSQAIPPAYTEHIGHQIMATVEARRQTGEVFS